MSIRAHPLADSEKDGWSLPELPTGLQPADSFWRVFKDQFTFPKPNILKRQYQATPYCVNSTLSPELFTSGGKYPLSLGHCCCRGFSGCWVDGWIVSCVSRDVNHVSLSQQPQEMMREAGPATGKAEQEEPLQPIANHFGARLQASLRWATHGASAPRLKSYPSWILATWYRRLHLW